MSTAEVRDRVTVTVEEAFEITIVMFKECQAERDKWRAMCERLASVIRHSKAAHEDCCPLVNGVLKEFELAQKED